MHPCVILLSTLFSFTFTLFVSAPCFGLLDFGLEHQLLLKLLFKFKQRVRETGENTVLNTLKNGWENRQRQEV